MAHALTRVFDGIVDSITTNVTVKNSFTDSKISTIGIWDTGATGSVITKSTAQKLGLKPVSAAKVRGVHGERIVNVYAVEITLHNDQITLTTSVTECDEVVWGQEYRRSHLNGYYSNGRLLYYSREWENNYEFH